MPSRKPLSARTRKVRIRQVDPSQEGAAIQGVLERNLVQAAGLKRLEWLYLGNPDGRALVWLAEDDEGRAVGTSAAHPRRMRIGKEIVRALNLSDFAFDAAYRSLGPALKLLKATLEPVRNGDHAFSYDFPSQAMHALYRRMGGADLGAGERWVRPVDFKSIAKRTIGGVVGRVVGAAGGVALRARDALAGIPRGIDVTPLEGEFGAEFDALDAKLAGMTAVAGVRDAAYLDWRYRQHAMFSHDVLCARRNGELLGFVVVRPGENGVALVLDLFAGEEDGVRRGLAAAAVDHARAGDAEALHVEVLAGSPAAKMFSKLGFVKRDEGAGPVPFSGPDGPAVLRHAANWWITGGDRDV